MPSKLNQYFDLYPTQIAPFLHEQRQIWAKTKPLNGLTVLNHVPVVPNSLLKIANLIEAGAKVVVTNPMETLFGAAVSTNEAITKLTNQNLNDKKWLVFGFGKIGRGICYFCHQNRTPLCVVDSDEQARITAQAFNIETIDPQDLKALELAILNADIIVTATGKKAVLDHYPKNWFQGKIMANMGVLDEFGPAFSKEEVLNEKTPVNFILNDPTPMKYIDPALYVHNQAVLELFNSDLNNGVSNLSKEVDEDIITRWCYHHQFSLQDIKKWFAPIN